MSGLLSASGLITGLDSGTLISQLLQIERQPITRLQNRIAELETQRDAVRSIRTQLTTLRNRVQDFRFNNIFDAFGATSSEDTVLSAEVSSSTPVVGSFEINVTQLASATVAESSGVLGGAIDPNVALNSSGISTQIEAGTFTINGVEFTIDPATDSLSSIMSTINSSAAGVTATYDSVTDTVSFENSNAGDTNVINFGGSEDTSNLLDALAVTEATQATSGTTGSTVATSTRHLGAIDATEVMNTVNFAGGAVTAGSFSINGISISVDPTTDSLIDVIERINSSDAGVTASYDSSTDGIRLISNTLGSRTIRFGGASDTSNFLSVANLSSASQIAGKDAQFTVNGGAVQTRNTNEVADAISGVTVRLLSTGTSTVTVSSDNDSIVEDLQTFITEFNSSVSMIKEMTGINGTLSGDTGIGGIETFLWQTIFGQVASVGDYDSLISIGITTGDDFDATATSALELDEDTLREALRDDRTNIRNLFSNNSGTGIADLLYSYLDEATKVTGFLNDRSKSNGTIDQQIQGLNDQIDRKEDYLSQYEARLRRQFTNLETMASSYQSQSSALSALGFSSF